MPLQAPRLDDRAFEDLVIEARRRIPLYTPEWTDHNLSDPGITLIELFAWLIDIMLYRINRVPEKHYIKFMELLGMVLREPEAAYTESTFWLTAPQPVDITLPIGTEVATTRTETEQAIVFATSQPFKIYVPTLTAVLSSRPAQRSGESRSFMSQNMRRVTVGFEGFPAFANPPQVGDAMYFGFGENLSRHILGLDLDVDIAAGAGVDPTQPPYVWEVLSSVDPVAWTACELDVDNTKALNQPGVLSLHLPRMVQGRIADQTAYWLRVRLIDPPLSVPKYRSSPVIKRVNVGSWGITVDVSHNQRITGEVIGRSDGTPGQRFTLNHMPILKREPDERLMVVINNNTEEFWEEVPDFGDSSPDSRHYVIDSGTGELRFGPALPQRDGSVKRYGAIPPQNSALVFTRYRTGGGTMGNVKPRMLNILKTSLPYVSRVTNRREAIGGLDSENLEDAKMRVPAHLRTLQRAVTAADYEYLAMQAAPGVVQRVHALQPPTVATGEVKVLVVPRVNELDGYIPPSALALPDEVRDAIRRYLDDRRLISTRLDVLPPAYFWVSTRIRLRNTRLSDPESVKLRAERQLYDYLNPINGGPDHKGWPFGRSLYVADIINALRNVSGIEVVHAVDLIPINWDNNGKPVAGEITNEIKLVAHGTIASYRHTIELEE
jgi:predicted phage baseplate assembly protein